MLCMLPLQKLEEAARDEGFIAHMNRVYENFQKYLHEKPWFEQKFGKRKKPSVAYFSVQMAFMKGFLSTRAGWVSSLVTT